MPSRISAALGVLWKDFPVRVKAAIIVGLPLLVLAAAGLIALSTNSLRENGAQLWLDHTIAVRGKLGSILQKVLATEVEASTALVSTGTDGFDRLAAARAEVDQQIHELEKLIADDPNQNVQMAPLRALVDHKFQAMESMLSIPHPKSNAVTHGLAQSRKAMEPLQKSLAHLDREEVRLQELRSSNLNRARHILIEASTQTLALGFIAGLAAALVFGGIVARRVEDLRLRAHAMRSGDPLADEDPSRDEIGEVRKELSVTSERLAERTRDLRERESELRAIVDNTTAVIYVKDLESRFLMVNRALETAFGLPAGESVGKLPEEFFQGDLAAQIRANDLEVMESGKPCQFEETVTIGEMGRTFLSVKVPLLDEAGAPYALCGISTDITESKHAVEELQRAHDELENRVAKRTEELERSTGRFQAESTQHRRTAEALEKSQGQLLRAQKVEIVGTVASGIAHEFNNVLTAIMGHASFLGAPEGDEGPPGHATHILYLATRAAALSRQLVAFGRIQPNEPQDLALGDLLRSTENMLQSVVGETIELQIEVEPGLEPVRADPAQLEQLLLHLVTNARDAMPTGGKIVIAARRHGSTDPNYEGERLWARVSVQDNGTGISAAVQAQLFEPFFTTKEPGQGTGLGLASAAIIAEQNNGWLDCESEQGHGSTFTLYLPCIDTAVLSAPPPRAPAGPVGNETVLVVEDEPAVGQIVALLLRTLGYNAITAENGEAALRVVAEHEGKIDLVLTDLNMPRMNGQELLRRLSRTNPNVRVLLTSGSDRVLDDETSEALEIDFLPKPFSRETLANKVRMALSR